VSDPVGKKDRRTVAQAMSTLVFAVALAVLCVSTTSASVIPWQNVESFTFASFLEATKAHAADRMTPEEFAMREGLFLREKLRVVSHNSKNLSWKETLNKFSALTDEEKRKYRGFSKTNSKVGKTTSLSESVKPSVDIVSLPKNVDWRNEGIVTAVKDQGYCGSCWAFASTATIESHVAKASGLLFDLSVEQTAFCSPNPNKCGGTGGCAGATAELAFSYYMSVPGILEDFQWGYTGYTGQNANCSDMPNLSPKAAISGYVQLPENNYTALLNALAFEGPVSISVDASNWGAYSEGIFSGCSTTTSDIDHAVVAVGYGVEPDGKKYWLVRNSWSPTWGEKGYIKLARDDGDEESCQTDSTPENGSACEGDDAPIKTCGTCGCLYDSSYPTGAKVL